MKYSKDGVVRFDPLTHRYYKGHEMLQGVTSYISQFKRPFDSDTIAEAYALKRGLNKADVLNEWWQKSQASLTQGHAVHKVFEDYAIDRSLPSEPKGKEAVAVKFITEIYQSGRLTPLDPERIVYNGFLASQIDQLCENRENKLYILDWKTNSRIDYTSFNDCRMLGPFAAYPDCSFYHYSIQVAIYRNLFPEAAGAYIVHIGETDYQIIKPAKIELPKEFYENK